MAARESQSGAGWLRFGPALLALALAGCASTFPMMPAPVLYTGPQARALITEANPELRTPSLELLYVTDRERASVADPSEPYTADRSRSMSFGTTTVRFGENLDWNTLVERSVLHDRATPVELTLGETHEIGRYPHIPYDVVPAEGGFTRAPRALAQHEAANRALQAEVRRQLASHARKELVLFVHGYRNTFSDSARTMAQLCHFFGREFACGVFSWPAAGRRGILFGYEVDYESSEFAAEDLKKALRTIAATPDLKAIHLIAHSRGTALLAEALAELSTEAYIAQTDVSRSYKIGNVLLIAPDIDVDVAPTKILRVLSDPDLAWGSAAKPDVVVPAPPDFRITVYASPNDRALAASSLLFGSIARLGRFDARTLGPEAMLAVRRLARFDVIEFTGRSGYFGHSYFVANPQVSADIVAMLRYGLRPNEPGRPLVEIGRPFWRIPNPD